MKNENDEIILAICGGISILTAVNSSYTLDSGTLETTSTFGGSSLNMFEISTHGPEVSLNNSDSLEVGATIFTTSALIGESSGGDVIIIDEDSSGNIVIRDENDYADIEKHATEIYNKFYKGNDKVEKVRREPLVLKGDDIAAFNEIMNTYDARDLYFYICALQRSIIKRLENGDYVKDGKGIEVSFSLFRDMLEDDNCCKKKVRTKNNK